MQNKDRILKAKKRKKEEVEGGEERENTSGM